MSSADEDAPSRWSTAFSDLRSRWAASSDEVVVDDGRPDAPAEAATAATARTAQLFPSAGRRTESEFTADWSLDDDGSVATDRTSSDYELPEIVPATDDVPATPNGAPRPGPVPARPRTATSYTDLVSPVPTNAAGAPLRQPGRRPRVRRVTRVVRHIDPWSTFKVALIFSAVAYVVVLTSGVLLWRVADDTGTLDNVERWFTQFGWETFELKGGEIFQQAWIIGLFGAVFLTGGLVLTVTLFNLVSDIVGGVRVSVLEEEVVERTLSSTRRYVVRRGPPETSREQHWDVDDDEPEEPAPPSADWSVD